MVEDVVLLHGFGGTSRAWDATLKYLPAQRYRPIPLDLPGHGDQSGIKRAITFERCVASVLERSPKRFVLAGYSMGGRIALHVARAAPDRVERLVLISTMAGIDDPGERSRRSKADRRLAIEIKKGTIEEFADRWRSQQIFVGDPPEVDALARADYARNRPEGLAAALRGVGTGEMEPLWERLAELPMPVTVLAGRRDSKFVRIGERMVSLIHDSLLQVTSGGHCLLLENPKISARAIT